MGRVRDVSLLVLGFLAVSPANPNAQMTELQRIHASDSQAYDFFGTSVGLSGDRAVAGAWGEDGGEGDPASSSGAAYVFEKVGNGSWVEVAKLRASDIEASDNFGRSVAISRGAVLVGAPQESTGPFSFEGAAYVFERAVDARWVEVAKLRANDSQPGDRFGSSVSLSDDRAIVGAPFADAGAGDAMRWAGAAYVFELEIEGGWREVAALRASDPRADDRFGQSVSIRGDHAIVGVPSKAGGLEGTEQWVGAAYVFERHSDGRWNEVATLRASDGQAEDSFGYSVAIDGEWAVVGAQTEDGGVLDPVRDAGAAYMFQRLEDGSWSEAAVLRAHDRQEDDFFGVSSSICGDRVIVSAIGVGFWSGAAYVFERRGSIWEEVEVLQARDRQSSSFGYSVSLDERGALVGANGWSQGTSVLDAGAAYAFGLVPIPLAVSGFEARFVERGVQLSWTSSVDEEYRWFHVFRQVGHLAAERLNEAPIEAQGGLHFYVDSAPPMSANVELAYRLQIEMPDGHTYSVAETRVGYVPGSANVLNLSQNSPNPFNPATRIRFSLPHPAVTSLRVLDAGGRLLTTLVDCRLEAGSHSFIWTGTSSDGRRLAAGVYYYELRSAAGVETKAMALVK